jgi:hypothetical protein
VLENDGVGFGEALGVADGVVDAVAVGVSSGGVAAVLSPPPDEPLLHAAATNASRESSATRAFISGTLTLARSQPDQAVAASAS